MAAGFQHGGTCLDYRCRIRDVLQHFQASDNIVLARMLAVLCQLLDGDLPIIHVHAALHAMQPRDREGRLAHVDAGNMGPTLGHAL